MAEVGSYLSRKKVARRVLVVDDESYARTTVCHWLTRAGFQCGEAASADEAMARLQDQEAHLLTLDITRARPLGPGGPLANQAALARYRGPGADRPGRNRHGRRGDDAGGLRLPAQADRIGRADLAGEEGPGAARSDRRAAAVYGHPRGQGPRADAGHPPRATKKPSSACSAPRAIATKRPGPTSSARGCTANCSPKSSAGLPNRSRTSAWPRPCTTWARSAFPTRSCKSPASSPRKSSRS